MTLIIFAVFIFFALLAVFINYKYLIYLVFAALVIGQLGRWSPSPDASSAVLLLDVMNAVYVCVGLFLIFLLRRPIQKQFSLIMLFGFVATMGISLLFGSRFLSPTELMLTVLYAVRLLFMFGTFVVTLLLFPSNKDKDSLQHAFISAGLILVALGYFQLLFFPSFAFMAQFGWDPHEGRLLSTFFDPNFFGMFLVMIGSVLMATILMRPKDKQQVSLWLWLGATVLAIFLTFSRSSYLAFLVSFLLILTIRSWKLVLVALVAIILIGGAIPRVRDRVVNAVRLDTTAQDRIQSWREAGKVIKYNPWIGVGYNAFGPAELRYHIRRDLVGHSARGSDSSFLLTLATTGIIGFMFYILFWLSLFISAMGRYRLSSSTIGLALLGIIPSYLIHSQFVNGLFYPLLFIPFAILMASDLGRTE